MTRLRALLPALAAAVCAVVALASVPVAVSAIFAVPLVLVLPGYALLEALEARTIGGAQRVALVPSLSIALTIGVALVVDLVHSGLTARSWAIGLVLVVAAASVVAAVRGTSGLGRPRPVALGLRRLDVVALVVAVAVLVGTVILVRTPLAAKRAQGYTILSLLQGKGSSVVVTVQSGEQRRVRYRLVVGSQNHVLYRDRNLVLEPADRTSVRISLRRRGQPVSATLYRGKQNVVYRHVSLR
jgi:uncharacterized membrane protein